MIYYTPHENKGEYKYNQRLLRKSNNKQSYNFLNDDKSEMYDNEILLIKLRIASS